MQIILVQSEVEDAIRDYVSKQITVGPNTDINIDLAATRGAEGVKAIIDLVPATGKGGSKQKTAATTLAAPKPAVVASAPVQQAQQVQKPATPVAAATPAPAPASPVETAAVEPVQDEPVTPDPANEQDEEADGEQEQESETAPEPPATPPVRSLFANLKKPTNQ